MWGMPSVLELMRPSPVATVLVLALCSGCGSKPTAPSTATTDTSSTTLFQGTLDTGGIAVQSFNAPAAQTVKLMLASVSAEANRPLAQPLVLTVGTLSGSDCTASSTVRATPALTGQLSSNVAAGSFCVSVSDPESQIVGTVTFSLRVVIGSPTPEASAAGTTTWATAVGTNGSASRTVAASAAGTMTISLDSLSYTDGQLGLGLGIPGSGRVGCELTLTTIAGTGGKVTASVESGEYCVKIYDVGRTTGMVNVSTTISSP
jgi:hypothetical protein